MTLQSSPVDIRTSVLLRQVLDELPDQPIRIGSLLMRLRRRSFGGLLILLAVIGLVPGISVLAGLAMTFPGVQLAIGLRSPLVPRFIRRRAISRARLVALFSRLIPLVERLERYVRPRWLAVGAPPVSNLVGLLVVGLGLVVALPLPFSNVLPAIALVCLALGLVERDGLMTLLGMACGLFALSVGVGVLVLSAEGVALLWRHAVPWN